MPINIATIKLIIEIIVIFFRCNVKPPMTTKHNKTVRKLLTQLFDAIPYYDAQNIIKATKAVHLKHLPISINIWLSTIAYIRHSYTDYDSLLHEGFSFEAARHSTTEQINQILENWRCHKRLNE